MDFVDILKKSWKQMEEYVVGCVYHLKINVNEI